MSTEGLKRYWANNLVPDGEHEGLCLSIPVYKAAKVDELYQELVAFLQDFIEWNACNKIDGVYKCNQCGDLAIAGQSNHTEDCEILEAKRLVRRMTDEL